MVGLLLRRECTRLVIRCRERVAARRKACATGGRLSLSVTKARAQGTHRCWRLVVLLVALGESKGRSRALRVGEVARHDGGSAMVFQEEELVDVGLSCARMQLGAESDLLVLQARPNSERKTTGEERTGPSAAFVALEQGLKADAG